MSKLLIAVLFTTTLLSSSITQAAPATPNDPFESTNRSVYRFNKAFDATVLKPLATVYKSILPPQMKTGIRHFFMNLQLLPTIANDILQMKPLLAYKDAWRLTINTTIGAAGLFDVAKCWDLPHHSNDLGLTLKHWGIKHSPYIVIPFWGPSTLRDTVGIAADYLLFSIFPHISPTQDTYGLLGLDALNQREQLLPKEHLLQEALDEYAFVRDAYLQYRVYEVEANTPQQRTRTQPSQLQHHTSTTTSDENFGYVEE